MICVLLWGENRSLNKYFTLEEMFNHSKKKNTDHTVLLWFLNTFDLSLRSNCGLYRSEGIRIFTLNHKNHKANMLSFYSKERCVIIDQTMAPDSNTSSLPYFMHGKHNDANRNENGIYQSCQIHLLCDIVRFREFFSSWISSSGYCFKKLHDLINIPDEFEEFIVPYEFQHYLWDLDFVYYPKKVGNSLTQLVYVKLFVNK